MKKFFEWTKKWSAVIILAAFLACMVFTFICCLQSHGRVYPVFGAIASALTIAATGYQLIVECKTARGK